MSTLTRNFAFIMILMGILCSFACEERTPPSEEPEEIKPPPLEDGIPFDKLGSGKLVFHRTTSYGSVYVINIKEHKSWGIHYSGKVPMVSPDGSKIAFTKYGEMGTVFDTHVMSINGSNIQNISHIEGQDQLPTWTPDSNEVLFSTGVYNTLYRQSPIPNPPDRQVIRDFSAEGSFGSPVFVSKNFKLVFFFTFFSPGGYKVCIMDIDGTSLEKIEPKIPEGYRLRQPCWSPDEQKIAYLLIGDWHDDQWNSLKVMVMDADGKNARSLGKFELGSWGSGYGALYYDNDFSICWAPDGSKLVFNKIDGYHCSHLYLINADGTGLSQVTFAEGVWDGNVSWSIE